MVQHYCFYCDQLLLPNSFPTEQLGFLCLSVRCRKRKIHILSLSGKDEISDSGLQALFSVKHQTFTVSPVISLVTNLNKFCEKCVTTSELKNIPSTDELRIVVVVVIPVGDN